MYGRRRNQEVPPKIRLCGRLAVNLRVVVDKRKVLPLLWRIPRRREDRCRFNGRWVVRVGFLDVSETVAESLETLPKSGVSRMVGLRRHAPEEIIEVVESEANDDGSASRFRDAKLLLKLAIDEHMVKDQITLPQAETNRDSLSGLDYFRMHLPPAFIVRSPGRPGLLPALGPPKNRT